MSQKELMVVDGLKVHFPVKQSFRAKLSGAKPNWVKAVNDVSFSIKEGETLALVGELGCGKTTIGKSLVRLIQPVADSL